MPPILQRRAEVARLGEKACSSQKPYRFICAGNEPASFQSFVMCSTLNITPRNAYLCRVCLHGVVASAELAGVEEHAQNLHVVLGGNAGDDDAHDEQDDAAEQGNAAERRSRRPRSERRRTTAAPLPGRSAGDSWPCIPDSLCDVRWLSTWITSSLAASPETARP